MHHFDAPYLLKIADLHMSGEKPACNFRGFRLHRSCTVSEVRMLDRGKRFSQLVYQLLVVEKKISVEDAARITGLGYDAFHARINGRTVFSADEVAKLIACLPDPRLAAYLLRESRFLAVERVDGALIDPENEIVRATHRILLEAADVLEAVDNALHDKRIDHREALLIQGEIEIAERALVSLREHVRALS